MPRNLDISALRSFATIADTGGVTRAAARLNLTQSAVSMQLKRLELAFDTRLFDREGKTMMLTASGEHLLHYARRMLALNDEAWARMTEDAFEGSITLGAPHDVVYPHVPQILRRFAREYPRVRIQLQSSYTHKLKEEFARGEIDVILTTEFEPGGAATILQESPLVWIGAPNGQAWRRRPLPLAFETACIFRPIVQRALDEAQVPWVMAVDSVSTRTVDACISADFAVHAALASTVGNRYDVVEHLGVLPSLPSTKVAMYVASGPNDALSKKLADVVCEEWSCGKVPSVIPMAAE
ncbi:MAG: LysR family transcriptional regulator [Pseudomonadota bacterium]